MSAQIINRTDSEFTVQITVPYNRSMLDFEETVQATTGCAAGVFVHSRKDCGSSTRTAPRLPSGRSSLPARDNSPELLPDPLYAGDCGTTRLPKPPRRSHLLSPGP